MKIKWSKDNLVNFTTNFSRAALYAIAVGMLLWLNISSASVSGVAAIIVVLVLSIGIGFFLEKIISVRKNLEYFILGACCIIFWLPCMWWVYAVPYDISGDQAIVWQAAAFAVQGDFSMYGRGGQMFLYPQQQGLAFLYEMLFRLTGSNSDRMIGYINASLAPITLFFGYQCVKEIAGVKSAIRFLPLMMLCLPYIIYSPYVYGDIPSVCLSLVLFWAVLKFIKTMRYRYAVWACVVAALALICRMNMWIFLVGLFIGLAYHAWQKWTLKPVIFAICVVLCASLSMSAIKQFNSFRSGEPVSEGMPAVLWVAMGLQYSPYGAGHYNNYSKEVFREADYDKEQSAVIGWQEVKNRVKTFIAYPDQCMMFFKEKMENQWIDPLFESVKFTGTFDDVPEDRISPIVWEVYRGHGESRLRHICSMMMSVIYFFSTLGVVFRYLKKKPIIEDIPLIVFVGGFLFSIFWEAKARYMFPYFILLHLYAAYGLTDLTEVIKVRLLSVKKKNKEG